MHSTDYIDVCSKRLLSVNVTYEFCQTDLSLSLLLKINAVLTAVFLTHCYWHWAIPQ